MSAAWEALAATPATLAVMLAAALAGGAVGIAWGLLAGALGGGTERAMMALAGRAVVVPLPLLAVLATGLYGHEATVLVLALAAALAPGVAGPAHAAMQALRRREFLAGARAAGAGESRLFRRHLLPNAAGPLLAAAVPALPRALAAESLASFLGLGMPEKAETWGGLLGAAAAHGDAQGLLPPAVLLVLTLLALQALARATIGRAA